MTPVKRSPDVFLGRARGRCRRNRSRAHISGTATAAGSCPTAAPPNGGTPDWTLAGTTGSIAVIGPTDTTAPRVTVTAPFGVTQTQVHTLHTGDGPVVSPIAKVSVCYMGVNGRDGSVFDSSYERGAPVDFPFTGVVTGFQKAIAGQKVGSTVAVAMSPRTATPKVSPALASGRATRSSSRLRSSAPPASKRRRDIRRRGMSLHRKSLSLSRIHIQRIASCCGRTTHAVDRRTHLAWAELGDPAGRHVCQRVPRRLSAGKAPLARLS